ncbi:DUF4232 domain-containing protein [Streptomyces sp. NBC_01190]|uniref:DUF4232 domain-containing protein n=1 Tax=Streptomyces sp. NBC_01190 TaxID=2903767 RepID=UPI0038658630|nr:DUF4232 domain-containing protein [Streptomyces sp. NBC_01190]
MRKRSVAVAAAAVAAAAYTAVPATASTPVLAGSATPMCATSQLSVAQRGGDAGAGNLYFYLVFTNHSGTACHLTGYPGVSLLDAGGQPIGQPATREHPGYSPVVLKAGASASDTIHTVNHQGTCLPTSTSLRVYPPGNKASVVVPAKITECFDTFAVTPLAAGSTGNPGNGGSGDGATSAPATPSPTASSAGAATTGGQQVTAVPKGAPDTGLAAHTAGGGDSTDVAVAAGAGALAVGALGAAAVRRRRSGTRG